jgi:calcineurin-like phosphoesterase family protein
MRTFVTADMHFNHSNIIRYCKRPYDDVDDMNNCLIENWNKTVSKDDYVYHIGDFCFNRLEGGIFKGLNYWASKLNGNIIFLSGNHDRSMAIKSLTIHVGNKQVFIRHNPTYFKCEIPNGTHYVLCGHIHDKWSRRKLGDVDIVNVGVDVSDFKPNQLAEVVK